MGSGFGQSDDEVYGRWAIIPPIVLDPNLIKLSIIIFICWLLNKYRRSIYGYVQILWKKLWKRGISH